MFIKNLWTMNYLKDHKIFNTSLNKYFKILKLSTKFRIIL